MLVRCELWCFVGLHSFDQRNTDAGEIIRHSRGKGNEMRWKIKNLLHSHSWFSLAVILQALLILLILISALIRSAGLKGETYSDSSTKSNSTILKQDSSFKNSSPITTSISSGAEMCLSANRPSTLLRTLKYKSYTEDYPETYRL